jgi:hypothetical protein
MIKAVSNKETRRKSGPLKGWTSAQVDELRQIIEGLEEVAVKEEALQAQFCDLKRRVREGMPCQPKTSCRSQANASSRVIAK